MKKELTGNMPQIKLKFKKSVSERFKCNDPIKAAEVIRTLFNQDTIELFEETVVIYFDHTLTSIGWFRASQGGLTSTIVDQRLIFATGLKCAATHCILAHNHPSGSLIPSEEDLKLTKRLVECGAIIGIIVLDHFIFTSESEVSIIDKI